MTLIEGNLGTRVMLDGQPFIYFGGTNYLSMAHRSQLLEAGKSAFSKYGFSCSASRLTSGENDLLLELESYLARFAEFEAALVLPAGFLSNLAVVDALDDLVDGWLIQPHAHSSIRSALATSSKPIHITSHDAPPAGPVPGLEPGLEPGLKLGIFLEPINPLTGELTDVPAIAKAAPAGSFIIMDEAHSFAVLGTSGGGAAQHFNLDKTRLISTGTFSKAIGAYGGFVMASREIIELIKEKSGSYRGSTPLSPVVCAAALAALHVIAEDRATTIDALRLNVDAVNQRLRRPGLEKDSPVPIFYVLNPLELPALEEKLRASKIFVPVVGSYFKAACDLAFRWTIHATHKPDEIEQLLSLVEKHLR
jgi:8-amino-7-oxononanoate synthase